MKIYLIIKSVILIALAVLIGVFSHHLLEHYLQYLVGGVMILFGIEGIFLPFALKGRGVFKEYQFYLGHVDLLLGLLVFIQISDISQICIVWGTWTIVRESFELYENAHKMMHGFPAVLSLALSIIEIVFSILLILFASEPHHHALTHIYLLVPELILYGLSPLMFEIYLSYIKKKKKAE